MNDKFDKPTPVSGLDMAFGGSMSDLLPEWKAIPDDFKRDTTKWNKIVSRWFFMGLPNGTQFIPRDGIDNKAALAHIRAILASFSPKHEHKEAGCAWLLSRWFTDIVIPDCK